MATYENDTTGGAREKGVDMRAVDRVMARSVKPFQPHQKAFIRAFMRSTRRGTIAIHSPGSGKTLMAMGCAKCYLAEYPDSRVIIVAPASLIEDHRKQMADYEKKLPGGRVPGANKFHFYTYEGWSNAMASGELKLCEGALLICDEAQKLKGAETQIFADIHACAGLSTKVILLSATPITNEDKDLFNLMTVANGDPLLDARTMETVLASDKLMRAFFGCQLSWYKSDPKKMAAFFPKKETRIVPIPMDTATLRNYNSLENGKTSRAIEGIFGLSGEDADTDLQSFFNGLRRISSSSAQKIDFMIDYIKCIQAGKTSSALGITRASLNAHTDKFVIFTHFKEHGSTKLIDALKKAHIPFGAIDGSVPKKMRSRIVADYVAGKIKVILISAAGATGLNLLETGYIFLVEPSWNMSEVQQVEARGVRYLSHAKLPKSKHNVLIMKLMLVKPNEVRAFDKIIADRGTKYEELAEPPSIDIKMYVDSMRKQEAIDARLRMLEEKVPSLENCGDRAIKIESFGEMRVYKRSSAKIASTPQGVRSRGSYYTPGRQMFKASGRISFNDTLAREVIAGSGALRVTDDTAIVMAGATDLLAEMFADANKHIFPHIWDRANPLTKRCRIGVINWAFDFATGATARITEKQIQEILAQFNAYCDLLLIVTPECKRAAIKGLLPDRKFAEATYTSEFDKITQGTCGGIVVIAC